MSEKFGRASKNATLIKLPGAGHFDVIDPRTKYWPAVLKSVTAW
jgi:pimeloyl-ACP methyl ester carboxylesterase